jgi:hypothetical protein
VTVSKRTGKGTSGRRDEPEESSSWEPPPPAPSTDPYEDIELGRRHKRLQELLSVDVSAWALAAGYLGLTSIFVFPAPLALISGLMGIRACHRDARVRGMGRSIFGAAMGLLFSTFLVLALFGVSLLPTIS